MRRLPATLSLVATLSLGVAGAASAATGPIAGGAPAPQPGASPDPSTGGGAPYERGAPGKRRPARRRRASAPLLASFGVNQPRLFLYGRPAQVGFRIRSRVKLVGVRISLGVASARKPASTLRLGPLRAGVQHRVALTGRESGTLAEGSYRVRISAKDARGRRLR